MARYPSKSTKMVSPASKKLTIDAGVAEAKTKEWKSADLTDTYIPPVTISDHQLVSKKKEELMKILNSALIAKEYENANELIKIISSLLSIVVDWRWLFDGSDINKFFNDIIHYDSVEVVEAILANRKKIESL